jgi:hypothetical protein
LRAVRAAIPVAVVAIAGAAYLTGAPTEASSPSPEPSPSTSASPSTSPSPAQLALAQGGHWDINGVAVTLVGAGAGQLQGGGNTIKWTAAATKDAWKVAFSVLGSGPLTANGTVTGPGPVFDVRIDVFGAPLRLQGTPGSDFSVHFGNRSTAFANDLVPAAAVLSTPLAATPEEEVAGGLADWLRGFVAFTIIGLLLILVAPGLKGRASATNLMRPLGRIGLGFILLLDVPLAAVAIIALGLPLGLWWVGVLVLLGFVAFAAAGFAYAGIVIGRQALDRLGYGSLPWLVAVPLGIALVVLLSLIPYAGTLITIVLICYGMGTMLLPAQERAPAPAPVSAEQPALEPAQEEEARRGRPAIE